MRKRVQRLMNTTNFEYVTKLALEIAISKSEDTVTASNAIRIL